MGKSRGEGGRIDPYYKNETSEKERASGRRRTWKWKWKWRGKGCSPAVQCTVCQCQSLPCALCSGYRRQDGWGWDSVVWACASSAPRNKKGPGRVRFSRGQAWPPTPPLHRLWASGVRDNLSTCIQNRGGAGMDQEHGLRAGDGIRMIRVPHGRMTDGEVQADKVPGHRLECPSQWSASRSAH